MITATILHGERVEFTLRADSANGWKVEIRGQSIGLVYRLGNAAKWKARPSGRPAPVTVYESRAKAIRALIDMGRAG